MASQLRFDGPVLEDVLDRVRREVGPGARIVAANRVRRGGVAGFFAKEHFEVIVERAAAPPVEIALDDPAPRPHATPAGSGRARVPASILDLAERVNDDERGAPPARHTAARGGPERGPDGDVVIDLVDDRPDFASLLEAAAADADVLSARPPAFTDAVQEQLAAATEAARRSATAARVADDPVPVVPEPDDVAVITETVTPAVFRRVARTEEVIERPENALARLGLPARLVPRGVELRQLRGALIESLSRLPAPPLLPDAPGVVVVVVGTGAQPLLLARDLADELQLDPDRVVLATRHPLGDGIPAWLQVCDPEAAEERRRSWRRRPYPTLVALSMPPGREQLAWAREMLDQFEPTCTWAIVEAGWKGEDVRHWADTLGGLDVLALTRLSETVSPAAVLDLGIPVGRIDGRPANPVTWAEHLLGRVEV